MIKSVMGVTSRGRTASRLSGVCGDEFEEAVTIILAGIVAEQTILVHPRGSGLRERRVLAGC